MVRGTSDELAKQVAAVVIRYRIGYNFGPGENMAARVPADINLKELRKIK